MPENITIIIPCRNEAGFIGKCLDSVLDNGYPHDFMEVLVVDGMSVDGTRSIVGAYTAKYPFIRLLDNPLKIVSAALNMGIKNSRGNIIIRMDAHNIYEKDYILRCVNYMGEYNVDNVGGICITKPANASVIARSIALALSHPFGVGNAYFRIGSREPRYVDTVPFGCYKRELFDKIGFFDEELIRNQDDEFNARLIKKGGKILLHPGIRSYYFPRTSLGKLWRMYFQYGYFKPLAVCKIGSLVTYRQLIPGVFIASLAAWSILSLLYAPFVYLFLLTIGLYMISNVAISLRIACREEIKCLPFLPVVFATLHFSYGLGYLKGIMDFVILKKSAKKTIAVLPLSR